MAKKKASAKNAESKSKKQFVSDPSLLKKVEGKKDVMQHRDKDGKIQGGTLYYGELK